MTNWILSKMASRKTLNSGGLHLDALYRQQEEKRDLLFMPTWRFNLHNVSPKTFLGSEYSSAVLDASFIHTPIAYCQWDAEEFFREQPAEELMRVG